MNRRSFLQETSMAALSPLLLPRSVVPWTKPASPTSDDVFYSSASEIAKAIAEKRISSSEVVEILLTRIERHNASLNAIVHVFGEEAKAEARKADADLAKGKIRGPLHGVPITIKDAYAISGKAMTWGNPAMKDDVQETDSIPVSRFREAGAILIGQTNMPLLGDDWQTFNELHGVTNNPWDLERTPGGSSGGCAAAVAAGMSYLSLGGDLGGSIRVPAHFCGVFGHRPSRGIVPIMDVNPNSLSTPPIPEWEMAVAGPLARSAQDLKIALAVIGGFSPPRNVALQWRMPRPRKRNLRDYRIGYVTDDTFCPVVPEIREVYEEVVEALRSQGVNMIEGWPEGFDLRRNYLTWQYLTFSGLMTGGSYEQYARGHRPPGEETYFDVLEKASRGNFYEYKKKHHQRLIIQEVWRTYFKSYDAFLLPPAFIPAFFHDPTLRKSNLIRTSVGPRTYGHLNVWPSVSGLSGNPSTTFPVGSTAGGLPVGLEILGPTLEDATPIDLADKLSDLLGGFRKPDLS